MRRALAWAALLLGVAPSASGHGTSKSYAELRVSGRVVEARVSFAAHDLAAATPGLDADGDGRVTAQELEDATAALGPHLSAQLAVRRRTMAYISEAPGWWYMPMSPWS